MHHYGPDNIQIAFVVFRSMEGRERVLQAYKKIEPTFRKRLSAVLCCPCRMFYKGKQQIKPANVETLDLETEKAYFESEDPERLKFMD